MPSPFRVALTRAFLAGLDVEMGGAPAEVAADVLASIHPQRLDDAVARVLALKEALGLFDDPYVSGDEEVTSPSEKRSG